MKKFITDPSFWQLFPEAKIAVLSVKNVQETAKLTATQENEIRDLLEKANAEAKKYVPNDPISENEVVAVWRKAYQKFPTKKGARCSIEALLKRVLHDNPVGIHEDAPTVDITNAVSLKYAFPIGAEDMDKFDGDIHLGVMKGGELFLPIGETESDPPKTGELAYYDKTGAICRCWNWRDGQRTEVTEKTTSEFIIMECVQPERTDELARALDELSELMQKYVGAQVINKQMISRENPEMVIEE